MSEFEHNQSIAGMKFPGFGKCIFCGSTGSEGGLRREHIIPYSLGGNAEILAATCADCEGKTSYIDGYLANSIYKDFRIHGRFPSRSKTTKNTTHLSATYRTTDGGPETTVDLPVADHPYWVHLPILAPPGILTGREPNPSFLHRDAFSVYFVPPNFPTAAGLPSSGKVQIRGEAHIKLPPFARAIAKIAYCHAVANFGLGGFDPLDLPDLILGKYAHPSHYVGGDDETLPRPREPNVLHAIDFSPVVLNGETLIQVAVRLFAYVGDPNGGPGLPEYRVVVGKHIA